tara:strand:- start:3824 stop:4339 length:516 start_codon:yes stop_codon:yes gene_type:complete
MLYVGFDTSGTVLKITNEPDDILQYLEISAEMFEKFTEGVENIDDYVVVKKHDYVLEKKDGKQTLYSNILTLEVQNQKKPNSIYIIQNPKLEKFIITHTFSNEKTPPSHIYKKFFVTKLNNTNKLLCTLECKFEDFLQKPFTFDAKYFNECKIITQPDMQSYYHIIGETIE